MSLGSETNPSVRVKELYKRRDEIDADIARTLQGSIDTLDDTAIKERFQQFSTIARELLADFREVDSAHEPGRFLSAESEGPTRK